MKKKSAFGIMLGSAFAFLLATSCCWLPFLLISLGAASGWGAFASGLEKYSWLFMLLAFILLGLGIYYWRQKKTQEPIVILASTITCPNCQFSKLEEMPTDACQFFYECSQCKSVLKPLAGDCCVYCSYGTVKCPPIQKNEACC